MATGSAAGEGEARGETVLVTGASGFIGSWLVRLLLARGYSVHAAVLDPGQSPVTVVFVHIFLGCSAAEVTADLVHLAPPCTVDLVLDPQKELVIPAVEGTLNVLRAAKEAGGVRRVVVTSSVSAAVPCPGWPAGEVLDERCWTDLDYCDKNGVWYPASKALAEKAAWKFAEENGLDVVTVMPGTVMGEMIPPRVNASMAMFLRLLEGCTEEYADFFIGPVHVEDVALAHILLYENPSASGRHFCVEPICHWSDFAAKVAELYPGYKVNKFPEDTQPGLVRAEAVPKKLMALGLQFSPLEKIIRDAVESLRSRGFIA